MYVFGEDDDIDLLQLARISSNDSSLISKEDRQESPGVGTLTAPILDAKNVILQTRAANRNHDRAVLEDNHIHQEPSQRRVPNYPIQSCPSDSPVAKLSAPCDTK